MTTTDTTPSIPASSIVVATDGSDDARRAVRWAADQASREHRPLTVLATAHAEVLPAGGIGTMSAAYAYDPQQLLADAHETAQAGARLAHALHPDLDVTGIAQFGAARHVLIELSHQVHMIVLGSRGRGFLRSKLLGSVSAAVSRDAACPVVVCRPVPRDQSAQGGILVGADGTPESLPVIEFAFRQASLTGETLTVVHAVWDELAAVQGPGPVSATEPDLEAYRLLLGESVAGISPKFPDVPLDLRLARGMAQDCLQDTSGMWSTIIVGRHPVDSFARLVTSTVATAVIERAHTTVVVVPQAGTTTAAGEEEA
ncbi:universal stress protein [Nocardioides jiangxiensis]|uniref:Universal stress protein n=1 Tax=Nocardioides jiangxiensis TaxID=3064524 RepID=A0ABT9B1H0_9ACTN|nr:universal stress protein [Nocardioides sp. WY-20]MDO7867121.1 universal stress protein [Nocardioides sp. WY-20]